MKDWGSGHQVEYLSLVPAFPQGPSSWTLPLHSRLSQFSIMSPAWPLL